MVWHSKADSCVKFRFFKWTMQEVHRAETVSSTDYYASRNPISRNDSGPICHMQRRAEPEKEKCRMNTVKTYSFPLIMSTRAQTWRRRRRRREWVWFRSNPCQAFSFIPEIDHSRSRSDHIRHRYNSTGLALGLGLLPSLLEHPVYCPFSFSLLHYRSYLQKFCSSDASIENWYGDTGSVAYDWIKYPISFIVFCSRFHVKTAGMCRNGCTCLV